MTETSGQAAAGWYPDPSGAPRQRYYDGQAWTEHYHGEAATTGAVAQATRGPLDYWKTAMTEKYATFEGRSRRAEYWWTAVINIGIIIVLTIIGAAVLGDALVILPGLFMLAILIPSLALAVRRLHDTNKTGWWLLLEIVPFGGIVLLVFFLLDSERGPNQYGPSPKY